jgi:hypothetical protein
MEVTVRIRTLGIWGLIAWSLAGALVFAQDAGRASASAPRPVALPASAASLRIDRQGILGLWRLVRIDYSGPNGPLKDPVFGPNPSGTIIYDSSGWMSVQIVTGNRPRLGNPATRLSGLNTLEEAQLKAAALDSYYAYFGTWTYDSGKSTISHHLVASLLPDETGLDYQREVQFDGRHLSLIVHRQSEGEARTRTLVWERLPH